MTTGDTFTGFLRRIRAGDQQAAEALVREYEPYIRREVHLRMRDSRLGRLFDSMDICQSVLASFFVRVACGQFDLECPEDLVKLLAGMARNKLAEQARRQQRQRRDCRRVVADGPAALSRVASPSPSPSRLVAGKELLEEFRQRLSEEERQLADRRARGLGWAEIAAELGGMPQARRMQLARGVERVTRQLGLEDTGKDAP